MEFLDTLQSPLPLTQVLFGVILYRGGVHYVALRPDTRHRSLKYTVVTGQVRAGSTVHS